MKRAAVLWFVLSASSAVSADAWWQWHDGQWCFRSDVSMACLPDAYVPIEIMGDQVKFVDRDPALPARFVEFHSGPLTESGRKYPDESFVLSSRRKSGSTLSSKYIADVSAGGSHAATLFVITLDDRFTLLLYGSEDDEISHLADSIVQQWNDE